MPKRSPARWAAPAALAAAALAVYVVISPHVGGDDGGSRASPAAETVGDRTTPAATTPGGTTGTSRRGARKTATTPTPRRTYVVKPGDTLSSIATANGVTVEQLQRLNPGAESSSLTVGERIVLRDDEGR